MERFVLKEKVSGIKRKRCNMLCGLRGMRKDREKKIQGYKIIIA
jgi:hypothetical protein